MIIIISHINKSKNTGKNKIYIFLPNNLCTHNINTSASVNERTKLHPPKAVNHNIYQ